MEWHHPARPRLGNGRPALLDEQGRPICALPYMTIGSWPDAQFELLVSLPVESNTFAYYSVMGNLSTILETIQRLGENPEEQFRTLLGWGGLRPDQPQAEPSAKPSKPGKLREMTLADLDL